MGISFDKIIIENRIEDWNTFFSDYPITDISLAANPSFAKIFSLCFGLDPSYYMIIDTGSIIGVLPGFMKHGRFISMPVLSSGGAFLKETNVSKTQIYQLFYKEVQPSYEIREFQQYSSCFINNKVTCHLNLLSSEEEQLGSFKSKLRSQILKGYKNGLVISIGGAELLPDFYKLYAKNLHRLGTPVTSIKYFSTFLTNYRYGDCAVFTVKKDSKTIGAAITFSYQSFFEVMWASTDREYNFLNSNMVLYWEMMKYAIQKNMKIFSFGRSSKESASLTFKRQWGVKELPLFFNVDTNKNHTLFRRYFSSLWRHLPYRLTLIAGPLIRNKIIN